MKITAVTTVGTYYSWAMWGCASIYNSVDNIIVINGGFNPDDIQDGDNIPLQRELKQLKEIDIDAKITQIRPMEETLKKLLKRELDWERCEKGRARNITLAFQLAYHTGADWVLKFDSDQVFDESFTREALEDLANNVSNISGFRFAEYADFYRDWGRVQAFPGKFTDDGTLFFKAHKDAWAVGGGSPVHYSDQHEIHDMRSFHMRRIAPPDVDEYDYHYKRLWYHIFGPNSVGEWREDGKVVRLTEEQIVERAEKAANDLLCNPGHTKKYFRDCGNFENKLHMFPPNKPPVVAIGPIEYIKKGLPDGKTIV